MGIAALLLIAIGLSMDAFAVAVCKGLAMKKLDYKYTLLAALFFGGFQALMPLIGWFAGQQFEKYITGFDHWIAFGLLFIIGAKMIYETVRGEEDKEGGFSIKTLILLAVATSIDALAVGITFAILPDVNIILSVAVIGIITFLLSALGVLLGHRFGGKIGQGAGIAGGIILILIGLKILLEHLGVINF